LATIGHRLADELHQIDRASDVRIDDVTDVPEVLIEKRVPQPMSGVGEQGIDGPPRNSRPESIHTLCGRQVSVHNRRLRAQASKTVGGRESPSGRRPRGGRSLPARK
jgi:hypothetical protein